MGSTTYLVIAGILFFAAASFFFAVSESALFALGKWRARQLTNKPNGVIVDGLLSRPSELLATIVLGNTIANSAIIALGVWPALAGYWPLFPTLVGLVLLILSAVKSFQRHSRCAAPNDGRCALRGPCC